MECCRILAIVQVTHTVHKLQFCIGKAECSVCSLRGCKQKGIEILDSTLLKCQPYTLHIGQSLLRSQLSNLGFDDPVDTLFIDDQQAIFVSEVLHILRTEADNLLESIDRDKTTVVSELISSGL